ncbi:hypothetical protein B7494_g1061 [Chlorociboria aeruginascens]|nr:hypothetical protein B7494_g1061 [Chlorociboria aeruginascens]
MLPSTERTPQAGTVHAGFYVLSWIFFSSLTILFNKYILDNAGFHFPAILTCWHMVVATLITQLLARASTILDNRKAVKMSGRMYLRAIVPIGILYSASLVCSNQTYLYLSVAFIQMLKAAAPISVLLTTWIFGIANPKLKVLFNILIIVFGITLSSLGEIKFLWIGFFFQLGGIISESMRLVLIQILLSGEGQKMDPLVSLYYYAPVCAVMNFIVAVATESGRFEMKDVEVVGGGLLILNALVAFALNVASVFLIGKTSSLVMTLCGVLKNILLVVASVLIWGTVVTRLQVVGYGIALGGLVYYAVGYEGIKTSLEVTREFGGKIRDVNVAEFDNLMGTVSEGGYWRKGVVVFMYTTIAVLLVGGLAIRQSREGDVSGSWQ